MTKDPIVSVVIPFYRNKKWLTEALESVFSQTFKDFEVILINDGSNEDISDILDKYQDRLIYRKQENEGPASARNKGISIARGKYIAFEDSDDIWLPTKLEKQISFMEQCSAQWSHTGFYNWWPKSGRKRMVNNSRDYSDIYLQRQISVKMATPCVVIEKELLDKENLRFPEEYKNGEDGYLYTKIAKNHEVALIQEPLALIRMHGNNSKNKALERISLKAESFLNKRKQQDYPQMIIHILHIYYIYDLLLKGKFSKTKEFLAKLLWIFPYCIERIYVRYLYIHSNKNEKYILRWK